MNKVYLSGMIANTPELRMENDETAHLVLVLCVRHRNRGGEIRKEYYRVSAWNNIARWAVENLIRGQIVGIQGYLTQHQVQATGMTTTVTEIAAEEFLPMHTPNATEAATIPAA